MAAVTPEISDVLSAPIELVDAKAVHR
jgi:hypothetical protein